MTPARTALLILALIVCIVPLSMVFMAHKKAIDEASSLVMELNRDSLGNWNPQTLLTHLHSSLETRPGAAYFESYIQTLQRRLGALQEIRDISYEIELGSPWQLYSSGSASYNMKATFSNGPANIRIRLIRENGHWLVSQYSVMSALMAA